MGASKKVSPAGVVGGIVAKAAAGAAVAGATAVATQVMNRVAAAAPPPPPPPPPPKVWGLTLRRTPPLTEEDKPPIGDCEKWCWQCVLIPPACCTFAVGSGIMGSIQCCACALLPCLGTAFAGEYFQIRKTQLQYQPQAAREQIAADVERVVGCGRCLLDTALADYKYCIRPLPLLWGWSHF